MSFQEFIVTGNKITNVTRREPTPEPFEKVVEVGDTVRLKSGGPVMVVSSMGEDGKILCRWFSGRKLQEHGFVPETLVHTSE